MQFLSKFQLSHMHMYEWCVCVCVCVCVWVFWFVCFFSREGFYYVGQAGLELLTSDDLSTLTS